MLIFTGMAKMEEELPSIYIALRVGAAARRRVEWVDSALESSLAESTKADLHIPRQGQNIQNINVYHKPYATKKKTRIVVVHINE